MPISARQAHAWFEASNFQSLPVSDAHALAVETLPLHHGDPFDRLLIAQAKAEPMRLLSHDAAMAAYGELVVTV
jgi:PIN domain nuclease of toxin-antitoxin system